jgi:hypothetical protein
MPDEIEVPLEQSQEHIEKAHEEHEGHHGAGEGEKGRGGWTRFIAVATAILAVVAAIAALKSGLLVNEALLAKNNEISHRTQASDQWNYYQAEGLKALIYKTSAQALPPGSPAASDNGKQAAHYKDKQDELQRGAKELEKQAEDNKRESAEIMEEHHIFALSVSLCQIAIALSAIAALTRSRRVWFFGLAAGLAGIAALIGGFLGLHLPFAF